MVAVMPGVRQKTKKPCKQAEEEARWKEAFKEFNRANDKKSWDLKRTGTLLAQQEDSCNCGMFMMIAMQKFQQIAFGVWGAKMGNKK